MARIRKWTIWVAILAWFIAGLIRFAIWPGIVFLSAWLLMMVFLALFGHETKEELVFHQPQLREGQIGFSLGMNITVDRKKVTVKITWDWRDWLGVVVGLIVIVALIKGINPITILREVRSLV